MPDYVVEWRIELTADTPRAAAKEAWGIMRDPNSTASCFDVIDASGVQTPVDVAHD